MGMSKTTLARVIGVSKFALSDQARAILNKYGATMLLPGVSGVLRFGYQPGNYRESTGQTLAGADQEVGLVVDAARVPGPELVASPNVAGVPIGGPLITAYGDTQVTAGKWYEFSATVSDYAGTETVGFDTWTRFGNDVSNQLSGNGVRRGIALCTSSGLMRVFTRSTNTCNFSNISVRELPGIHASQSTSGFQPVLRNASGIQSWQFDGTDDRLSLSAVPFQMADDHFVVSGLQFDATGWRHALCVAGSTTTSARVAVFFRNGDNGRIQSEWTSQATTTVYTVNPVPLGTPAVFSVKKTGTTFIGRLDGVQQDSKTASLNNITAEPGAIGRGLFNTNSMGGHIHGVIFGKGAISDSELLTLERFMATLQGRAI